MDAENAGEKQRERGEERGIIGEGFLRWRAKSKP